MARSAFKRHEKELIHLTKTEKELRSMNLTLSREIEGNQLETKRSVARVGELEMDKIRLIRNNELLSAKVVEVVGEKDLSELKATEWEEKYRLSEQQREECSRTLDVVRLSAEEFEIAAEEMARSYETQEKAFKELVVAKDTLAALHSNDVLAERKEKEEAKAALDKLRREMEVEKGKLYPRMQMLLGYHVALTVERLHERGFMVPKEILNGLNAFDETSVRRAVTFLQSLPSSQD
ncbi:hypothetical protein M5689_024951 [Euphorbia peplus]|nr:hypothetical protein M5689_024951 [Euphorbia peplus]